MLTTPGKASHSGELLSKDCRSQLGGGRGLGVLSEKIPHSLFEEQEEGQGPHCSVRQAVGEGVEHYEDALLGWQSLKCRMLTRGSGVAGDAVGGLWDTEV